jgi:hypothetical protein
MSRSGEDSLVTPLVGGYYWVPAEGGRSPTWSLLICHDLGLGSDAGHAELWPRVIVRIADDRGKDSDAFLRRLSDHYTGLPRGRVTRSSKGYLVLHGGDNPIANWRDVVLRRFNLMGVGAKFLFDEHECRLADDAQAVVAALRIEKGYRIR